MFGGRYSNNIENYQNLNLLDDSLDSDSDMDAEEEDTQEEMEPFQNNDVVPEEENIDVEEEYKNYNSNRSQSQVIEGFSEGKKIAYGKHKLLLKSILFGILFYLLSNENIYKLTKPMLKNTNPVLIHTLIFVGLHYFINIMF